MRFCVHIGTWKRLVKLYIFFRRLNSALQQIKSELLSFPIGPAHLN